MTQRTFLLVSIIVTFSIDLRGQQLSARVDTTPPFASAVSSNYPWSTQSVNFVRPTKDSIFIDFVGTGDIQKSVSNGDKINANTGLGIIFERYYLQRLPKVRERQSGGSRASGRRSVEQSADAAESNRGMQDQVRQDLSAGIEGNHQNEDAPWKENTNLFQSLEVEGLITIASTADSLLAKVENGIIENRRTFGTYILNPISAKQSAYINGTMYFGFPQQRFLHTLFSIVSGINGRVIASNSLWQYDGNTSANLGVMSLRLGVFHEILPDNLRLTKQKRSKYSLFIGVYHGSRWIFGDITSPSRDQLRTDILGSADKRFSGWELNFGFRLNNLRAEFQMPALKAKSGVAIDGLTNTQFLFSIKFVGGFGLKIQ